MTYTSLRTTARTLSALIVGLLCLSLTSTVAAQFTLSVEEPYQNEPVVITLPQRVDTLTITYRPSSSVPQVEHLATGGATTVNWTPARAGVVALSTSDGTLQNVSVRYQQVPIGGVLVLLLAGSILFGGALFAFRKLFQDGRSLTDPAHRPDT